MSVPIDLTGQRFGRLTAQHSISIKGRLNWQCLCDCGALSIVHGTSLRTGLTKSCGCLQRDTVTKRNYKHGDSFRGQCSFEYNCWCGIKKRCLNPNSSRFHDYGRRGITICKRWLKFENFLADMGRAPGPGYSIERVKVDGHYRPSNCMWLPKSEQAKNTRRNHWLTFNGETRTLADWARITGIPHTAIFARLRRDWSIKETLATSRIRGREITFNGVTHILSEWARIVGIGVPGLHRRLRAGWSIEKALTTPVT